MAVLVDIFVSSTEVVPAPIVGAVVSVYDMATGVVLAGQATTDADGLAAFSLPGGDPSKIYEVRAYKQGVVFGGYKRIEVVEPLPTGAPQNFNTFDVTGNIMTLPVATDPYLCRCTGRFVNFSNQPIFGATVRIITKVDPGMQTPKVLNGSMVSAEVADLKTDANGFVTVDLPRGGEYYITFSGETDSLWNFKIPEQASANLIDLIHPAPVLAIWDQDVAPGDAITVQVGETVDVPLTVRFSDYEEKTESLSQWILLMNSSDSVVTLEFDGSVARLTGLASGAAVVTVEGKPEAYPSRVPPITTLPTPLMVTVS
jgi:hypothetical protein